MPLTLEKIFLLYEDKDYDKKQKVKDHNAEEDMSEKKIQITVTWI